MSVRKMTVRVDNRMVVENMAARDEFALKSCENLALTGIGIHGCVMLLRLCASTRRFENQGFAVRVYE